MGVLLDGNFTERTCKVRDNCQFYLHDLFKRYPKALGEGEMIINEPGKPCTNYLKRREIIERKDNDDPFAPIVE